MDIRGLFISRFTTRLEFRKFVLKSSHSKCLFYADVSNFQNEIDNYDWFLKADDDTYFVMENLRTMLLPYSPNDPLYFGCRLKVQVKNGYMSGGAGYVLSRESVRRFVEDALPDPNKCNNTSAGDEDVQVGLCLQNVGVTAMDTRDNNEKHKFLAFSPESYLDPKVDDSVRKAYSLYMYYPYEQGGPDCCSEYIISFHYVDKQTMYLIDNLLYHSRPIGFVDQFWKNQAQSDQKKSVIEILKEFASNTSQPNNSTEPNGA